MWCRGPCTAQHVLRWSACRSLPPVGPPRLPTRHPPPRCCRARQGSGRWQQGGALQARGSQGKGRRKKSGWQAQSKAQTQAQGGGRRRQKGRQEVKAAGWACWASCHRRSLRDKLPGPCKCPATQQQGAEGAGAAAGPRFVPASRRGSAGGRQPRCRWATRARLCAAEATAATATAWATTAAVREAAEAAERASNLPAALHTAGAEEHEWAAAAWQAACAALEAARQACPMHRQYGRQRQRPRRGRRSRAGAAEMMGAFKCRTGQSALPACW